LRKSAWLLPIESAALTTDSAKPSTVRVTFAYRNEGRRSVSDADDKRVYAEDSEIEASDLPLGADA